MGVVIKKNKDWRGVGLTQVQLPHFLVVNASLKLRQTFVCRYMFDESSRMWHDMEH